MKTLKVKFLKGFPEGYKKAIFSWLNKFNIIENYNYDYVFFFEQQYTSPESIKELLNTKHEAMRIFICGEALYPDLNLCDYTICFDSSYKCGDRILSIPFELFYENNLIMDIPTKNFDPKEILQKKTKFCNFIYGNPNAHKMRDKIFWAISKYKKVDSLGSHLNNVKIKNTRHITNWKEVSIQLKQPYKFSIAAENSNMKGYTTEKIKTSMIANTIPIYFGNPNVNKIYNPKSFINASDFETLDDLVEYVKKVDNDDDLWCQIMSEQWQFDEQKAKIQERLDDFHKKFDAIFEQDIKDARRRADGFWINCVNNRIFAQVTEPKKQRFSFFEKIFSVKNSLDRRHKIVSLLGIKFKFKKLKNKEN